MSFLIIFSKLRNFFVELQILEYQSTVVNDADTFFEI